VTNDELQRRVEQLAEQLLMLQKQVQSLTTIVASTRGMVRRAEAQQRLEQHPKFVLKE
jgi:hypothetical protein